MDILLPLHCVPLLHPLLANARTFWFVVVSVIVGGRPISVYFILYLMLFPPFDFAPSKSDVILLPARLPLVEPHLRPLLHCGHLLLVGCCVCCCPSVAV